MVKPFSTTLTIEILHLRVGKKDFSFEYRIFNGKELKDSAVYHSRHSRSTSFMRKALKDGYAVMLALENGSF